MSVLLAPSSNSAIVTASIVELSVQDFVNFTTEYWFCADCNKAVCMTPSVLTCFLCQKPRPLGIRFKSWASFVWFFVNLEYFTQKRLFKYVKHNKNVVEVIIPRFNFSEQLLAVCFEQKKELAKKQSTIHQLEAEVSCLKRKLEGSKNDALMLVQLRDMSKNLFDFTNSRLQEVPPVPQPPPEKTDSGATVPEAIHVPTPVLSFVKGTAPVGVKTVCTTSPTQALEGASAPNFATFCNLLSQPSHKKPRLV